MENAINDNDDYLFRINIWEAERPIVRPNRRLIDITPHLDSATQTKIHENLQEILYRLELFASSFQPNGIQLGRNQPQQVAALRPLTAPVSVVPPVAAEITEPERPAATLNPEPRPRNRLRREAATISAPPAAPNVRQARTCSGPPVPLTPDEFILRELADIRRLLLQRFLGPGGDNLQNFDDQDELFDILGVLAHDDGDPTEPPPHFPVGDWVWTECEVCLDMKWLYRRFCCGFPACSECLRLYYTTKVNEGVVKIECCSPTCNAYVHRDEVSARLDSATKLKFHQYLLKANLDPFAKTCPRCTHLLRLSGATNLKNSKKFPERSRVVCRECRLAWCFICHCPWHVGLTCKQFRKGDLLLKGWAEKMHHGQRNAQKCPKCKVYIQRTSGCDHMHCSRCKTDFCYRCGDQLRKLKFFGDHYSKLSIFGCKYRYKANQPVQRKLIRGVVFGGKLMIAPILGTLGACAGMIILSMGIFALPVYGGIKLYRCYEAKHRPPLRNVTRQLPRQDCNIFGISPSSTARPNLNTFYSVH